MRMKGGWNREGDGDESTGVYIRTTNYSHSTEISDLVCLLLEVSNFTSSQVLTSTCSRGTSEHNILVQTWYTKFHASRFCFGYDLYKCSDI